MALIAVPIAGFAAVEMWLMPTPASQTASTGLGDLAPFAAIVTDSRPLPRTGDLAAAQTRITDLETAWDEAEPTLRAPIPTPGALWIQPSTMLCRLCERGHQALSK